jgi:hypothetical protein
MSVRKFALGAKVSRLFRYCQFALSDFPNRSKYHLQKTKVSWHESFFGRLGTFALVQKPLMKEIKIKKALWIMVTFDWF